jgi:hypothetical protein
MRTRVEVRDGQRTGRLHITMRRILPFVFVGLVAVLFGCKRQPAAAPADAKDASFIDYVHQSNGVFHHGSFSLIEGAVKSTWTIDDGKGKKSRDLAMTGQTFKSVWDSVNNIPDFKTGEVKDPNQQIDPSTNHVVSVISIVAGHQSVQMYMISSTSVSPAFREWLSKIGYTGE